VLLVGVHWLLLVAIVIIKLVQFEIGPYLTIKHLDLIIVHIFDQLLLLDFVLLLHYLWDFIKARFAIRRRLLLLLFSLQLLQPLSG
jgi:hypothetical protein